MIMVFCQKKVVIKGYLAEKTSDSHFRAISTAAPLIIDLDRLCQTLGFIQGGRPKMEEPWRRAALAAVFPLHIFTET
jgi:hypothetical protein